MSPLSTSGDLICNTGGNRNNFFPCNELLSFQLKTHFPEKNLLPAAGHVTWFPELVALVSPGNVPIQLLVNVALVSGAVRAVDLGPGQVTSVLTGVTEVDLHGAAG